MIKYFLLLICCFLVTQPRVIDKSDKFKCTDYLCKEDSLAENALCHFCEIVVPYARELILKNKTQDLENLAIFLCETLKIEDKIVCPQVLKSYIVILNNSN